MPFINLKISSLFRGFDSLIFNHTNPSFVIPFNNNTVQHRIEKFHKRTTRALLKYKSQYCQKIIPSEVSQARGKHESYFERIMKPRFKVNYLNNNWNQNKNPIARLLFNWKVVSECIS
jgi:AraC-like DNA-binding protein